MAELLMRIDNHSVKKLQTAFLREHKLSLGSFVRCVCQHVGRPRPQLEDDQPEANQEADQEADQEAEDRMLVVEQAIELFKQIDANGDGNVDWGEFSAFIIQLNKTQDRQREQVEQSTLKPVPEPNFRFNVQRKMEFLEASADGKTILSVEQRSDQLKLHSFNGVAVRHVGSVRITSNFISHQAIAGCLLEGLDQVVVSTSLGEDKFFLSVFQLGQIVAQREQASTLSGQRLMRWQPDSETLATTGTSRGDAKGFVIFLYRRSARTLLHEVRHRLIWHHKRVVALEFLSPHHLASAALDGTVSLWDVLQGTRLGVLDAHESGVLHMSAKLSGPASATAWSSFWSRATAETPLALIATCPKPRFGDDKVGGRAAASCATLWRATDKFGTIAAAGQLVSHRFPTVHVQLVHELAITCDSSGECCLWNVAQPDQAEAVQAFRLGACAFLWAQDCLLTTEHFHGADQLFRLTRAERERSALVFSAFNETMGCIVTATKVEVAIWDAKTGARTPILVLADDEGREITACCLDDRKRKIIVGDDRGRLSVLNLMNGALIKELDAHTPPRPVTALHFCPGGRVVVSAAWGGQLHMCNEDDRVGFVPGKRSVRMRSVQLVDRRNDHYDITASALSYTLKQVATYCERKDGDHTGVVCVWDLEFARLQGTCALLPGSSICALRFATPALPLLLGLDVANESLLVWSTQQGAEYSAFDRLAAVPLFAAPTSLVHLCAPRNIVQIFIGADDGGVARYDLSSDVSPMVRPVRETSFRGNRQAHLRVRMEPLLEAAAAAAGRHRVDAARATTFARRVWLNPGAADPVTTLSAYAADALLFAGFESGLVRVSSASDGEPCACIDLFAPAARCPPIPGLDLARLACRRREEAEALLAQPPVPLLLEDVTDCEQPQRDPVAVLLRRLRERRAATSSPAAPPGSSSSSSSSSSSGKPALLEDTDVRVEEEGSRRRRPRRKRRPARN